MFTPDAVADPYLMLSPAGAWHAFAEREPSWQAQQLQTLLPRGPAWQRSQWLAQNPERPPLWRLAVQQGWAQESHRALLPPSSAKTQLDDWLPHAIAGLSGSRMAALASDDGFCLARVGYTQEEADTLCAAAADYLGFVARQQTRGFRGSGRALSFFESIDMLLPSTSLCLFWVDGAGYCVVLAGEPLLNNTALVALMWGLRAAGAKFTVR